MKCWLYSSCVKTYVPRQLVFIDTMYQQIYFIHPGVGITKPVSSLPLFSLFSEWSKHQLPIEYHVHIWQMSPQLSRGDTCQIWIWFKEYDKYFWNIENIHNKEIHGSCSNPHPRSTVYPLKHVIIFMCFDLLWLSRGFLVDLFTHCHQSYLTGTGAIMRSNPEGYGLNRYIPNHNKTLCVYVLYAPLHNRELFIKFVFCIMPACCKRDISPVQ